MVTSFDPVHTAIVDGRVNYQKETFSRTLYVFTQCARCKMGGLATVLDKGSSLNAVLVAFFPVWPDEAQVPEAVPEDIQNEFREAEYCAAFGANRAASALFRSVLEKALKANGYTRENKIKDLEKRIDAAFADGILHEARRKRAHEDIRVLGNDVLHDEWREVTDDEVNLAHRYTQRVLEDLYDDRGTIEKILVEKGRLPKPNLNLDIGN